MKTSQLLLAALAGAAILRCEPAQPMDGARALPDPTPFAEGGEPQRVEGTLETGEFMYGGDGQNRALRYGALVFGNKEIAVRRSGKALCGEGSGLSVNVDGRQLVSFHVVPAWNVKGWACGVAANKADGSLELTIPFTDEQTKKPETLVCRLAKDGPSRARLTWKSTNGKGPLVYVGCTDSMPAGTAGENTKYRGRKVTFGDVLWEQQTRETLLRQDPKKRRGQLQRQMKGPFTIDPDNPAQAVTVTLPGEYAATERIELVAAETCDRWLIEAMRGLPPTGEILIDLHESRLTRTGTPPVGGIDFEAIDGFRYELPPTKNLFRNPSFERGLLFWRSETGGAQFRIREPQVHYAEEAGGLFGGHCLHIRPDNTGVQGLQAFPIPLEAGVRYTLSVWVKYLASREKESVRARAKTDVKLAISNAARGGPIKCNGPWGDHGPGAYQTVWHSNGWTRLRRTFTGDPFGLIVHLGGNDCLFDGIQLEKGEKATDFVAPPLEGHLVTDDPDNHLHFGKPSAFAWRLAGERNVRGRVTLTATDAYGETVATKVLADAAPGVHPLFAGEPRAWPLKGVFLIRADYDVGGRKWFEFERLTVVDPLENRHPTKTLFACFDNASLQNRGIDKMRRIMEWGWGSGTWGHPKGLMDPKWAMRELYGRFRYQNLVSSELAPYLEKMFPELTDRQARRAAYLKLTAFTPEMLKTVEELACEALRDVPTECCPVVAFSNEEESHQLVNGATDGGVEYGKIQYAFYRGAKRANPKFMVAPTHGTSGWNKLRGRKAIDQYLHAANLNGFKYDAVCVHPYGNIDGGTLGAEDADAEIAYMRELLAKHGYDPVKTPLYMSECYNVPVALVPSWGCDSNQDAYGHGKTGYDFGNREYQSACQLARMYLSYLKYWPQVRCVHCWQDPSIDISIQPMMSALAINTIGHLLPDPVYAGEARPIGGVRAYVWKSQGRAVAAIWAIDRRAELGQRRCPKLSVRFSQKVKFLDFMGNERKKVEKVGGGGDGGGELQLTSAPLYILADDAEKLIADLKAVSSTDAAMCVRTDFIPEASGAISARLRNLTDREQKGTLRVDGRDYGYALAPKGERRIAVGTADMDGGAVRDFRFAWRVTPTGGGKPAGGTYDLAVFAAPQCGEKPDWSKVPSHPFPQVHGPKPASPADLSAAYQVCWNPKRLFVRVCVKDSQLLALPQNAKNREFFRQLWNADGEIELYLDCGANGRSNMRGGYDLDDYRYDFAPPLDNRAGRGFVWRYVEVDHQLADGINMPTKEEAAQKVGCDFRPTADGYEYVLSFDSRYVEPLALERGTVAGFALYLQDKDGTAEKFVSKALTTGTRPDVHVQSKPDIWPLMILK